MPRQALIRWGQIGWAPTPFSALGPIGLDQDRLVISFSILSSHCRSQQSHANSGLDAQISLSRTPDNAHCLNNTYSGGGCSSCKPSTWTPGTPHRSQTTGRGLGQRWIQTSGGAVGSSGRQWEAVGNPGKHWANIEGKT